MLSFEWKAEETACWNVSNIWLENRNRSQRREIMETNKYERLHLLTVHFVIYFLNFKGPG